MTGPAPTTTSEVSERQRLGERLREARKMRGLNQEEVAEYLKIPRTALVDIESGQRRVEAIELTRLAKLYPQTLCHFPGGGRGAGGPPPRQRYVCGQASRRAVRSRQGRSEPLCRISACAVAERQGRVMADTYAEA